MYCRGFSHGKPHFGKLSSLPPNPPSKAKQKIIIVSPSLTFCQEEGILLQNFRDRNGRCIAIPFKSIWVRGRFDSPEKGGSGWPQRGKIVAIAIRGCMVWLWASALATPKKRVETEYDRVMLHVSVRHSPDPSFLASFFFEFPCSLPLAILLAFGKSSLVFFRTSFFNSVQTRCVLEGEAQKSLHFSERFSGGFWFFLRIACSLGIPQ